MDPVAPQPVIAPGATECWVSYRTVRHQHFAVLRFAGVRSHAWRDRDQAGERHPGAGGETAARTWRVLDEPVLAAEGLRRWIAVFPGTIFDVTAARAQVVVRAIEARDSAAAMAMVRA